MADDHAPHLVEPPDMIGSLRTVRHGLAEHVKAASVLIAALDTFLQAIDDAANMPQQPQYPPMEN